MDDNQRIKILSLECLERIEEDAKSNPQRNASLSCYEDSTCTQCNNAAVRLQKALTEIKIIKSRCKELEEDKEKLSEENSELMTNLDGAFARKDQKNQDLALTIESLQSQLEHTRQQLNNARNEIDELKSLSLWQIIRRKLICC